MGISSPSERSTGRCGSSTRGAARPSARPLDAGTQRSGRSASAPTVACSRWPWTRTAWTGSMSSSGRARCSSGTWPPGVGWGGRSGRAADRCSRWPSTGTARCLRPVATRGRLDLWDVATQARHGKPMRVTDDGVPSVAFDPSGRLVAAGGAVGPVRVWRVADQRPAFPPLAGHTGPVTGAAFDPAGSFLATTSAFGGTRLWDPATGLGYGDELVGSARPGLARADDRPSVPGAAERVQPGRQAAGRRGSRDTRDALGRRPGGLAPAGLRDRGPESEPRGVGALPPAGTPYRATCPEWPTS